MRQSCLLISCQLQTRIQHETGEGAGLPRDRQVGMWPSGDASLLAQRANSA